MMQPEKVVLRWRLCPSAIAALPWGWRAGYALAMPTPYHPPVKRSVEIAGHKTSISLEPVFWSLLKRAAAERQVPVNALVARIDAERLDADVPPGLASAIRVWLATSVLSDALRPPGEDQEPAA